MKDLKAKNLDHEIDEDAFDPENLERDEVFEKKERWYSDFPWGFIVIVAVMLLFAGVISAGIHYATVKEVTFTVTGKDKDYHRKNTEYKINTDEGTLVDQMSFFTGKFSEGSYYDDFEIGNTYTCQVSGINFLFWNGKNIDNCRPGS